MDMDVAMDSSSDSDSSTSQMPPVTWADIVSNTHVNEAPPSPSQSIAEASTAAQLALDNKIREM
eukprot:13168978-Ditylum_brightwellii.AAC.1